MKPWQLIAKLEATSGRKDKEALIEKHADEDFWQGARYTYDALITFGVKKVPEMPKRVYAVKPQGIKWTEFQALAVSLYQRKLTGHAARDAIEALMNRSFPEQWNNWYRRILRKDFKCGVTDTTINTVYKRLHKKDIVPTFSCQLASDGTDEEGNLLPIVAGEKIIDIKIDGVRVLTVVYPNGSVSQFSRNGKELLNFTLIKEQFESIATGIKEPFVFDGEVKSASFQDLMKQVRRKTNVQADDSVLNLFDMIPLRDFMIGTYNVPQKSRRIALQMWFDRVGEGLPNVSVLGYQIVDFDTKEGQKQFSNINSEALAHKYEGIMLKDPEAPYTCKRSKSWLKVKPFIEVTLKVVGVEEGKPGTKNVGKLGALVCEGVDFGKHIRVNVGGGLSDELREEVWADPKSAIGQLVEVHADAITKSKDSVTWSLRFPRFKTFRGFAKGEKL
jgi:DNA ligase-1